MHGASHTKEKGFTSATFALPWHFSAQKCQGNAKQWTPLLPIWSHIPSLASGLLSHRKKISSKKKSGIRNVERILPQKKWTRFSKAAGSRMGLAFMVCQLYLGCITMTMQFSPSRKPVRCVISPLHSGGNNGELFVLLCVTNVTQIFSGRSESPTKYLN